jgi:hypothetical protein
MKCRHCSAVLQLKRYPVGLYFVITSVLVLAAVAMAAIGFRTLALAPFVMAIAAACATWTNMIDGCSMGEDGQTLGGSQV